jgi:hypothetical protein
LVSLASVNRTANQADDREFERRPMQKSPRSVLEQAGDLERQPRHVQLFHGFQTYHTLRLLFDTTAC